MLTIHELFLPERVDDQWRAYQHIVRVHNQELIGGPEWDVSAEASLAAAHADTTNRMRRFLAYLDGVPVGYANGRVNLVDSPELATVYVCVLPESRGRVAGTALAEHLWRELADARLYQAWVHCPVPQPGEDLIQPPTGAGAVSAHHAAVRLALSQGFALGQVSRVSRFDFARPAVDLEAALADALQVAGEDYEVTAWEGAAGDDLLDGLALLRQRMSTDPPAGGMTVSEARWDAERMRQADARWLVSYRMFRTVVRHLPTGDVVALNELMLARSNPAAFLEQWDTIVLPRHRGRRLGMAVKAANLIAVRDAVPAAGAVMTWNAEENRHMLAVNEALGFHPVMLEAAFERHNVP